MRLLRSLFVSSKLTEFSGAYGIVDYSMYVVKQKQAYAKKTYLKFSTLCTVIL
jgi:hypothetical protein